MIDCFHWCFISEGKSWQEVHQFSRISGFPENTMLPSFVKENYFELSITYWFWNLTIKQGITVSLSICLSIHLSVCLSVYVIYISQELFIWSTLHLAGVLLRTQKKCSVKFGVISTCNMFNIHTFWINNEHRSVQQTEAAHTMALFE